MQLNLRTNSGSINKTPRNQFRLPSCDTSTHTMKEGVTGYVSSKLPVEKIDNAVKEGRRIEVHGLPPLQAQDSLKQLGYSDLQEVPFSKYSGQSEFIKQKMFECKDENGKKALVLALAPGSDYVIHYGSLLNHYLQDNHPDFKGLSVHHDPIHQLNLYDHTGLDSSVISPNDTVLIGYTDKTKEIMEQSPDVSQISHTETPFYKSDRYQMPSGDVLNVLMSKHSFWGDMSFGMANKMVDLKAKELIFFGNVGCMTKPEDIHQTVFCPTQFLVMDEQDVISKVSDVPNQLAKRFSDHVTTGCHASIPAVLQETQDQRETMIDEHSAKTIDIELAQIALAISKRNSSPTSDLPFRFSAIGYASDFLYGKKDEFSHEQDSLASNRREDTANRKGSIETKIALMISDYMKRRNNDSAF